MLIFFRFRTCGAGVAGSAGGAGCAVGAWGAAGTWSAAGAAVTTSAAATVVASGAVAGGPCAGATDDAAAGALSDIEVPENRFLQRAGVGSRQQGLWRFSLHATLPSN